MLPCLIYFPDKIVLFFGRKKYLSWIFLRLRNETVSLEISSCLLRKMNKQEKLEQTSHNPGSPTI